MNKPTEYVEFIEHGFCLNTHFPDAKYKAELIEIGFGLNTHSTHFPDTEYKAELIEVGFFLIHTSKI